MLKQLQHFLSYLQQIEQVFIQQQIDTTLAERRFELSEKQKRIEKDKKRIKELDRLFHKIYEDNVNGKLSDERFYKLSNGYEAEQKQLEQEYMQRTNLQTAWIQAKAGENLYSCHTYQFLSLSGFTHVL